MRCRLFHETSVIREMTRESKIIAGVATRKISTNQIIEMEGKQEGVFDEI